MPVPTADRLGALQAAAGSPPTTRRPTHDSRNDRWNACSIKRAGEARVVQDSEEWYLAKASRLWAVALPGVQAHGAGARNLNGMGAVAPVGAAGGCFSLPAFCRSNQVCKLAAIIHGDAGFPRWWSILLPCQPTGSAWPLSLDA